MPLLKLAIVGRPNVGKSALFNRLSERRIAIVDEAEGVTRDRLYARAEFFTKPFLAIDTGGIDPRSTAPFNAQIRQQALFAIEEADTLVMVVDAQIGPTELDQEIADLLLKGGKPLVLAINKIDSHHQMPLQHRFHGLGIKKMIAVSATQGMQIAELLESVFEGFSEEAFEDELVAKVPKIAIVGRSNVGKSTLINNLLGQERCIASPIAGTTRDSIDIPFHWGQEEFLLIDTAGIRRKHKEGEVVDKFAAVRTERAIERADLCLLVLDATTGLTTQEKLIATQIEQAGKGCVLFFNKWDLVEGFRMEHCLKALEIVNPFLKHCPKLFGSALQKRNLSKLFPLFNSVFHAAHKKITTGQLNRCIERALQKNHPAMLQGKRLRIYYLLQTAVAPPAFTLFVNDPKLMQESYRKYLIHQLREQFGFEGVPILFSLRGKKKKETETDREEGFIHHD